MDDRLQQLGEELQVAVLGKSAVEAAKKVEEEDAEFGCQGFSLDRKGEALEGNMHCGKKVGNPDNPPGTLNLTGTMKYLGP